jgi:hypothetical protein
MNEMLQGDLGKARYAELVREADDERLAKQAVGSRRLFAGRWLDACANLMAVFGFNRKVQVGVVAEQTN